MEEDLLKRSLVDAVIPDDNVTGLAQLLEADGDVASGSHRLLDLKERETVFFDERLRVLAVWRVPYFDEDTFNAYLSRLSYKLEAWVIDESTATESAATPSAAPSKDLIGSVDGVASKEPLVLAHRSTPDDNADTDGDQMLTVVWDVEISLSRPRLRFPHPCVLVIPSAAIKALPADTLSSIPDLAPFQPLETNLLEAMRFLPDLRDRPPFLAASRLQRVLPLSGGAPPPQRFHIPQAPPKRRRAVPAAIARLRYHKVNTLTPTTTDISLLDVELIPFVDLDASITIVDLTLQHGRTESLMPSSLPLACRSGDSVTFLHKLYPGHDAGFSPAGGRTNSHVDLLSIMMRLEVRFGPRCRPLIAMDWTTPVDFTQALNPSFGVPSQSLHRLNRPHSLPVNGAAAYTPIQASLQPVTEPTSKHGLFVSFSAPAAPVPVGEPFTWKVLTVNHSSKPAKVAIIPLPRLQRQTSPASALAKRHAPKSSTASFHPSERRHTTDGDDVDIAQAVVDENIVYAMHHSHHGGSAPETDLMAMTAELRLGPLAPGHCHESEIQMVAFTVGTLRVDAIRVVDLIREADEGPTAPGVVMDVRDLPDVVVSDRGCT